MSHRDMFFFVGIFADIVVLWALRGCVVVEDGFGVTIV